MNDSIKGLELCVNTAQRCRVAASDANQVRNKYPDLDFDSEKEDIFRNMTRTSQSHVHLSRENKRVFPLCQRCRNPHKRLDGLCCSSEKKLDIITNGVAAESKQSFDELFSTG